MQDPEVLALENGIGGVAGRRGECAGNVEPPGVIGDEEGEAFPSFFDAGDVEVGEGWILGPACVACGEVRG